MLFKSLILNQVVAFIVIIVLLYLTWYEMTEQIFLDLSRLLWYTTLPKLVPIKKTCLSDLFWFMSKGDYSFAYWKCSSWKRVLIVGMLFWHDLKFWRSKSKYWKESEKCFATFTFISFCNFFFSFYNTDTLLFSFFS